MPRCESEPGSEPDVRVFGGADGLDWDPKILTWSMMPVGSTFFIHLVRLATHAPVAFSPAPGRHRSQYLHEGVQRARKGHQRQRCHDRAVAVSMGSF